MKKAKNSGFQAILVKLGKGVVWIVSMSIEIQAIFFFTFWGLVLINNSGLHIPYLGDIVIWISKLINVCIAYINEHMNCHIPFISPRSTNYLAVAWMIKALVTFIGSLYAAKIAKKRLQKLETQQTESLP